MYNKIRTNGTLLAWFGVILLAPDALLIRFSGLDGIALLFWRGLLAGGTLLILWMCFSGKQAKQDWAVILSPIGLFFVLIHVINVIAFAIGITMTSAVVMLTGLATMPLFTILFSIPILGERPNWQTWLAVICCMFGILIVVLSGHQAIGAPKGSPIIGGFLGVSAAAGLGLTMVLKRRNPKLPILLSAGWANIISVILAWGILGQQIPTLPQTALGLNHYNDNGNNSPPPSLLRPNGSPPLHHRHHRRSNNANRKHNGPPMGMARNNRTPKPPNGPRFSNSDSITRILFFEGGEGKWRKLKT